ncbi:hypothetical protein MMC13_002019 [Lambiella insularis]|nr:hypothetical protein [Lambiella insularis]
MIKTSAAITPMVAATPGLVDFVLMAIPTPSTSTQFSTFFITSSAASQAAAASSVLPSPAASMPSSNTTAIGIGVGVGVAVVALLVLVISPLPSSSANETESWRLLNALLALLSKTRRMKQEAIINRGPM